MGVGAGMLLGKAKKERISLEISGSSFRLFFAALCVCPTQIIQLYFQEKQSLAYARVCEDMCGN